MRKTLIISNKTIVEDWSEVLRVLDEPLKKLNRKLEVRIVNYGNVPAQELKPGKWGVNLSFMNSLKVLAKGYSTFIFHDPNFEVRGANGWFNRSISTPTLAVKQVFRDFRWDDSRYKEFDPLELARVILHEVIHEYCYTEGIEDETHDFQAEDNLLGYVEKLSGQKRTLYNEIIHLANIVIGLLKKRIENNKEYKEEPKIEDWAVAIKEFEGWFPPGEKYPHGSRSYRNNNPGNLRYSPYEIDNVDNFSIFPDYETGMKALKHQLRIAVEGKSKYYNPELTLNAFFSIYAPSNDGNHPLRYASYVAEKLGVTPYFKIKNFI